MYVDNPQCKKPAEDTIIWRYMDLTKFVSLLEKKALFFCRVDRLQGGDKFEGSLTRKTIERLKNSESHKIIESIATEEQKKLGDAREKIHRQLCRKEAVVNCWNMDKYESDAMWRLYATAEAGVAIKSTFKRLKDSFSVDKENKVSIGMVEYLDYDEDCMPPLAQHFAFMFKQPAFSHEKELRAVVRDSTVAYVLTEDGVTFESGQEPFKNNLYVTVNLETLVESVYFSPKAPQFFVDSVRAIMDKFDLKDKKLIPSRLKEDPPS